MNGKKLKKRLRRKNLRPVRGSVQKITLRARPERENAGKVQVYIQE